MIRRGKVGKGVVDVGSAVLFAGGELGFGRWETVISSSCVWPLQRRVYRSLRSRRFFIFSPYKKNGVGELFLLVRTA